MKNLRTQKPNNKVIDIVKENYATLVLLSMVSFVFYLPMLVGIWIFTVDLPLLLGIIVLSLSGIIAGPISSAFASLVSSWHRGKAYMPIRLFFTSSFKNFLRSAILGTIHCTVFSMLLTSINFYILNYDTVLSQVLVVIALLFIVVNVLAMIYSFTILINIDLKLSVIIKNSFIIVFGDGKSALIIFSIILGLTLICLSLIPHSLIFLPFAYFAAVWVLAGSVAYNTVIKHIAQKKTRLT